MSQPISFYAQRPIRLILLTRGSDTPYPDGCELATPEDLSAAGFVERGSFEDSWRRHFEAGGVSFDNGAGATIRYMLECMAMCKSGQISDHAVETLKRIVTIINNVGEDAADPVEGEDGEFIPMEGGYNLGETD